ncbi:MAG: hypothetical protein Q7R64_02025 [bacterium]|nr:hypothetical protein [bacterium]
MSHHKKLILPFSQPVFESPFKESGNAFERALRREDSSFWQKKGQERALKLFHLAAKRVPAYKEFLRAHHITHEKIRTIKDFSQVPSTDKQNYIQAYSAKDRSIDGTLSASNIIAISSGTSGTPTFWPRGYKQELEAVLLHDIIYRHLLSVTKQKTLIIICFPMGVYVSGVATLLPTWLLTVGYQNVSCVSAGNNKKEVLHALRSLAPDFEQVLLVGHPFFVKDILEVSSREKLAFLKREVKALFCSEGFSEAWREHLMSVIGIKNPFALLNAYGSSEMLLMAQETPMSVLARKVFDEAVELRQKITGAQLTPSLFQYHPLMRFIEVSEKRELLFTSESGIPLIRFNLKDSGQVIPFDEMERMLSEKRPEWKKEIKEAGYPIWKLPFVSLDGRSDQTIIFYAANIYPENIASALQHRSYFNLLTGKFTLRKTSTGTHEQVLEVHIELTPHASAKQVDLRKLSTVIFEKLKEVNREYADAVSHSSKNLRPRVYVWPYQHEKYFRPGLKPRYIEK